MSFRRDYSRNIKGKITEDIFSSLLEHNGYKVTPLGVEHSVKEVKALAATNSAEYQSIPDTITALPDFLVINPNHIEENRPIASVVEVKYRKNLEQLPKFDLFEKVARQVEIWKEMYLVLFFGEAIGSSERDPLFPHCKCFKLKLITKPTSNGIPRETDKIIGASKFIEISQKVYEDVYNNLLRDGNNANLKHESIFELYRENNKDTYTEEELREAEKYFLADSVVVIECLSDKGIIHAPGNGVEPFKTAPFQGDYVLFHPSSFKASYGDAIQHTFLHKSEDQSHVKFEKPAKLIKALS